MAVFVDLVSLNEQLDSLFKFLSTIFTAESGIPFDALQALLDAKKDAEFIELLTKQVDIIFHVNEKVTESFFMEFCCILRKFQDEKFHEKMAKLAIEQITSSKVNHPQLRLKIYEIFLSLLTYALESKNIETIIPHFSSVELWLSQWGATVQQQRTILKIMHDILNSSQKYQVEAYKVILKYLATFEDSDEVTLLEASEAASQAAVRAIKLDDIHQCDDLLELKAVKQLQKNEKTEKLYELLSLFAGEKLDSFDTFHQKYPSYLEEVGLSHEDCLKKIRLLSLATLSAENSEIKYSKIAETLNIQLDEVEEWVISSICAGLLEAKMDQLRQVVVVQRSTQRVFTEAHWGQLKDTIGSWRNNVSDLLQVLRSSKQIQFPQKA